MGKKTMLLGRMFSILVFATTIVGCRQDYSNPNAFMQKYGNEILLDIMSDDIKSFEFERFRFSNCSVGIDPYKGEYVKAVLTIVPKSGIKYYAKISPSVNVRSIMTASLPYKLSESVPKEKAAQLEALYKAALFGDLSPVFYAKDAVDAGRILTNICGIRIYRAKDGENRFRPVGGNDALSFYDTKDTYKQSSTGCEYYKWIPISVIKKYGILREDDKSAKKVIDRYVESLARANKSIGEIVEASKSLESLSFRYGRDGRYSWVEHRMQSEYEKIDMGVRESSKAAELELTKKKSDLQAIYDDATSVGKKELLGIRQTADKLAAVRKSLQGKMPVLAGDVSDKERALNYARENLDYMVRHHNVTIRYSGETMAKAKQQAEVVAPEALAEARRRYSAVARELADCEEQLAKTREKEAVAATAYAAQCKKAENDRDVALSELLRRHNEKIASLKVAAQSKKRELESAIMREHGELMSKERDRLNEAINEAISVLKSLHK